MSPEGAWGFCLLIIKFRYFVWVLTIILLYYFGNATEASWGVSKGKGLIKKGKV